MRVIDIDPIVEKLKNAIFLGKRIYDADTSNLEAILADIEAQPTAEPAVEIVHCEECIYYENENIGLCDLGGTWDPYDYCSNGRKYKHG